MNIISPPKILYKYRSLESPYTEKILSQGEIYFTPPEELNDPCEYFFKFDDQHEYPTVTTQETLIACGLNPKIKNRNPNGTLLVALSPVEKIKYFQHFIEKNNTRGIFSLSEDNSSILMNAFYADSSKGICIGFEWDKFDLVFDGSHPPQKNIPRKIEYSRLPPIIKGSPDDWLQVFTTKLNKFAFETEWRMFYKKGSWQSANVRQAIRSITFSPHCIYQKDWRKHLDNIVKWTDGLDINMFVAQPVVGQYCLDLVPFDYHSWL